MMTTATETKKLHFGMIMAVYLFGIFMGALDTGIVTPARTIIQNGFGVSDEAGVWMITLYTLTYAASIPVMGKLADRFGRKHIYILSISLFGLGSLLCGLSENFGSFGFLLGARAIQAVGGGGIIPVATAEFGTVFPEEKKGMALGLVGGVFGVANIFGSSAGSAILDIFGNNNWQFIFYLNVPICLFVVVAGLLFLPNTKVENVKRIDFVGILLLVLMVLSLLYGLKNIDFFDLGNTIRDTGVYPFLLAFVLLTPIFILVERRAEDPAMNLRYFRNGRIVITLVVAVISGILLMGMVFVPQFAENAMKIPTGDGGYFVIILGLFAGVGAPVSGKLIDRIGVKPVLMGGFLLSILGSLFLMFVAIPHPGYVTILSSLTLTGLGIGFTMGAPLNYMMLSNTGEEEAATALATLSLVRSIGTTVAPVIMVAFLAHAGTSLQDNVTALLPSVISTPQLPYAQELSDEFAKLKSDPDYSDDLANVSFPDLTSKTKIKIDDAGSDAEIPDDILELLRTSDVTNIVDRTKTFAKTMFELETPPVVSDIQDGVQGGIDSLESARANLSAKVDDLNAAVAGVETGIRQMQSAAKGIQSGLDGVSAGLGQQNQALAAMNSLYSQISAGAPANPSPGEGDSPSTNTDNGILGMLPAAVVSQLPQSVLDQLADVKTAADLAAKITSLEGAIDSLTAQQQQLQSQLSALNGSIKEAKMKKASLEKAVAGMESGLGEMDTTIEEMKTLKAAVPTAFQQGEESYLAAIDDKADQIEATYQKTLNVGFHQIYLTTALFSALGFLLLLAYKERKKQAPEPPPDKVQ